MDDYPASCKRPCELRDLDGLTVGQWADMWQQVRALQLQLKALEEKVYGLADTLYQHQHGGFKA